MAEEAVITHSMWAVLKNTTDGETCELYAYMFWKCPNSKLPFATRVLDLMYMISTEVQGLLRRGGELSLFGTDQQFNGHMPTPHVNEETGELLYLLEPCKFATYRADLRACFEDIKFYNFSISTTLGTVSNMADGAPAQSAVYQPLAMLNNLVCDYAADMEGELKAAAIEVFHSFFAYLCGSVLTDLEPEQRPLKRIDPDGGLDETEKRRH